MKIKDTNYRGFIVPDLNTDQFHALTRTLIGTLATLSSIGMAVILFLLPRWQNRLTEILRGAQDNLPDTTEGLNELISRLAQAKMRRNFAAFALVILALLPTGAVQVYIRRAITEETLVNVLSGAFFLTMLIFVRAIYEETNV